MEIPVDVAEGAEGVDGESPNKRMTRLRARGGVRDKPPIIDDDEDDFYAPVLKKKKGPTTKKPPTERRERVERPRKDDGDKEQERIERERDVTTDESSLYFIVRHSKSAIAVSKSINPILFDCQRNC